MELTELYRAHKITNEEATEKDNNWYEGDLIHERDAVCIKPVSTDATVKDMESGECLLPDTAYPVDSKSVCRCTGKYDIAGQLVFQNDVIENRDGLRMIIRYGTYDAFCPVDREVMDSVGFYAEAAGYPQMPIGNLNEYARVVGNIVDTPNIIFLDEK